MQSLPTIAFFARGEIESTLIGARPKAVLKDAVDGLLSAQV